MDKHNVITGKHRRKNTIIQNGKQTKMRSGNKNYITQKIRSMNKYY
jgi:hypothetical protein